jgi:hypothetical protein
LRGRIVAARLGDLAQRAARLDFPRTAAEPVRGKAKL